jgi:hypothetical protein
MVTSFVAVELASVERRMPSLTLWHVHALHDSSASLGLRNRLGQAECLNLSERKPAFIEALVPGDHVARVPQGVQACAHRVRRVDPH